MFGIKIGTTTYEEFLQTETGKALAVRATRTVDGREFIGVGRTKREARSDLNSEIFMGGPWPSYSS